MGYEIERKFLIEDPSWKDEAGTPVAIYQGYLSTYPDPTVRVRIAGSKGYVTIKDQSVIFKESVVRHEWEYEIPFADAKHMIRTFCTPWIVKFRYPIMFDGIEWVVDDFKGANLGLCVAEVELESADQEVTLPPWVGREVTADLRYRNDALYVHPFREWCSA